MNHITMLGEEALRLGCELTHVSSDRWLLSVKGHADTGQSLTLADLREMNEDVLLVICARLLGLAGIRLHEVAPAPPRVQYGIDTSRMREPWGGRETALGRLCHFVFVWHPDPWPALKAMGLILLIGTVADWLFR